jgi:endonuclease-3
VADAKRPFDLPLAFRLLRTAVKPYAPAALFQLADDGFTSLFEQLVSCIVSIRTFEEVTLPTCRRLFAAARTPAAMAALSVAEIDHLIATCTFHEPKAKQIHAIAHRTLAEFGGRLPCDFDVLTGFAGVGPKCANLAIGIACPTPHGIPVDVHVHRITNRWGIVRTTTPEKTMAALEAALPREYWMDVNRLLVPFGKFVCTARGPKCSTCPLLAMCEQVGVTTRR